MDVHALVDFYTLDIYKRHIITQVEYSFTRMNNTSFVIEEEKDKKGADEKAEHRT
jgi:hypothetical protein